MRRKRLLGASAAAFVAAAGIGLPVSGVMSSNAAPVPIYQNTSYSFAERAADLVSYMNLGEKAAESNSSMSPAIPSLGVATYGWWNESLHGVARYTTENKQNAVTTDNDTSYPDNNSLGSTWDPNVVYNIGTAIGQEARDTAPGNVYDLDFYAPTINLARDPRWGRNDETWSEDPLLTADEADQYVDGMQGEDQNGNLLSSGGGYYQAINTLKHFAAYDSEAGLNNSQSVDTRTNGNNAMDQRTEEEYDTLPFRLIVQQAHPGSVMSSYPEVNGTPSPASYYLLNTLLRQTFGFTGYVTGDCDTTYEVTNGHNWQPLDWTRPVNVLERSAATQAAGNDLTCDEGFDDANNYGTSLPTDTLQGIVTEEDVSFAGGTNYAVNDVDTYNEQDLDASDTRLFTARMELGEFDNTANEPYVQAAQARLAAEGVTGPYNAQPLSTSAASSTLANSNANGAVEETATRLAIARQAGDESIVLLKNSPAQGATNNALPLQIPATGAYNVAVVGEPAHPGTCSGTTNVVCTPNLADMYLGDYASTQSAAGQAKETDVYTGIKNAIQAINPNATVTFIQGYKNTSSAISGLSTVDTTNPALGDTASIYNLANGTKWNAVVVMAATDSGTGTEGSDRTSLTLPGAQASLIEDVYGITSQMSPAPPEIVYMETLGPIDVTAWDDPTPYDATDTPVATNPAAVLWSGYNSETQGLAFADVLLGPAQGGYNPSGRLASTWYHDVSDLPPITDYDIRPNGPDAAVGATNTPGRTYMYYNGPISYPFGYGLSYSPYTDSNELVGDSTQSISPTATTQGSPLSVNANDTIQVQVKANNPGSVAGNDVVELYVSQPNAPASLQRPIERLEGFQMVNLAAGASQTLTFNVKIPSLAYFNPTTQTWGVDDGLYEITVGTSSAAQDVQTSGFFNVTGSETPTVQTITAQPTMPSDAARDIQQRVFFPIGTTINPNLTVDMSNDQLYGPGSIVYNNGIQPYPAGMTFSYSSDHPSTVSVSNSGTITTLANGVATITATATYQGVSKSTTFVVRVLSYLSGITVNGNALPGFYPDDYNYDMTLPPGAAVPTVAATDPDSGATVTVTQAPAVPGVATITDTGSDGVVFTYTVNFAYGAQGDDFATSTLGSQWNVVRSDPTHWSLTQNPGALTLTPETGILSATAATAKNIFVQPELGNWTITTKAVFSTAPSLSGQFAGLIAYQNDQNYLQFGWTLSGSTAELAVTHEDNLGYSNGSTSTTTFTNPAPNNPNNVVLKTLPTSTIAGLSGSGSHTLWLQMSKSGPYYTESYSTNGTTWTQVYESGDSMQNLQVGVFAYNGTSATTTTNTVAFSPFTTTNATTTASLSPTAVDGWYPQNPTVTLSATDPGGPGILSTSYQVDGGGWKTYTGPFQITGNGSHTLQYYSTDDNGDMEAVNTQTVMVDTTAPVTTVSVSPTSPINGTATVTATATDQFSGVASTSCTINGGTAFVYTAPFTVTRGGLDTVQCLSTSNDGNVETPSASNTLTFQVNPQATTTPGGTVASTLAVSVSNVAPSFGTFAAGVANTYSTTVGVTVTTSAASSTLTAADPSSTFPGHLVNSSASGGPYEMPQGLEVDATSSNPAASGGGTYMNLANVNPATILSYSAPVSNDSVTVGFEQPIAATDALRTGNYTKTITIGLSTSTP